MNWDIILSCSLLAASSYFAGVMYGVFSSERDAEKKEAARKAEAERSEQQMRIATLWANYEIEKRKPTTNPAIAPGALIRPIKYQQSAKRRRK